MYGLPLIVIILLFTILCRGQYFEKHLKFIEHNTKFVPFTEMDLSYLLKVSQNHFFSSLLLQVSMDAVSFRCGILFTFLIRITIGFLYNPKHEQSEDVESL